MATYGTRKLHRWAEIHPTGGGFPEDLRTRLMEVLDPRPFEVDLPTIYPSIIPREDNYEYRFSTQRGHRYRVDFVKLKENDGVMDPRLLERTYVSVSFSKADATPDDYDIPTDRDEEFEVLGKVLFIIDLFVGEHPSYVYMFGDPQDDRKMNVYQYVIAKNFKDRELVVDHTTGFPHTKVGYYLFPPM